MGAVSPSELRAVSEKSLLLLAGTVADMEVVLLSFLVIINAKRYITLLEIQCSL